MKKILTLIMVIAAFSLTATAQKYDVPENYVLKDKADYAPYETQFINTTDWLQATPWTEEADKRAVANKFLMEWMTGSPSVSIPIGHTVIELTQKNDDLLLTFMCFYAKYTLQHKDNFDKNKASFEAIKAVLDKYTLEKAHKKDSKIEKLIKINLEGNLESWVTKNLN
jgi:hypothetical protein